MRALPDHTPETLLRLARQVYDAATRLHRKLPTDDSDAVLRNAASAIRHAHERYAGEPHSNFVYAAREINVAIDSLNALRKKRGEGPLP